MANVVVNSCLFCIVAVYVPNDQEKYVSFFCQLGPFLVDLSCIVLMGNWNTILNQELVGHQVIGQVDLISKFGLIDRYGLIAQKGSADIGL